MSNAHFDLKNPAEMPLREPCRDWREVPSLQHVVLEHFKSPHEQNAAGVR